MRMLLFDFSTERTIDAWVPINDVVMGGVSSSRLQATGNDTAAFTGLVSLENNGGFASVRSRPGKHDLRGYSGLELRIRGDARRYKINLKTDLDIWRRQPISHPPLDLSCVNSVGLMTSDRQAGPFRLEIARIEAYSD